MISVFDANLTDLTIVLAAGLSTGAIVSTFTWPLIDRGTAPRIEDRSEMTVFVGLVVTALGLIGLAAAPRLPLLNTIAADTWQKAGFAYLFSISWTVPILYGRVAAAESWVTLGRNWRKSLKYLCIAAAIAILVIVVVQGASAANLLTLLLTVSAAAAVRRST